MRYLLVSHIPWARGDRGTVLLDRLWAEDLRGLVSGVGPVTVAAPLVSSEELKTWGPGVESLSPSDAVSFLALPLRRRRLDLTFGTRVRAILHKAVLNSDIVHTSHLFLPYIALYYAHDMAIRLGKKALFVVAEDFYDIQNWDWVRPAPNAVQHYRRARTLRRLDREVRKRVASASLTFLHTPAAVARYRDVAANAVAIRQPVHEASDVISAEEFGSKCQRLRVSKTLTLMTACRMVSLKGVAFVIRAIALLKERGVPVRAVLYGSGLLLDDMRALARVLGVADIVELPGSISPGSPIQEALRKADIFLMPHLTTDFGRAFFDAMAAGTPVIAFRSIASQDTVRHGVDGLIAPDADFEGLAASVEQYNDDREFLVRCASAARARALVNTKSQWHRLRGQMIQDLFRFCPDHITGLAK